MEAQFPTDSAAAPAASPTTARSPDVEDRATTRAPRSAAASTIERFSPSETRSCPRDGIALELMPRATTVRAPGFATATSNSG